MKPFKVIVLLLTVAAAGALLRGARAEPAPPATTAPATRPSVEVPIDSLRLTDLHGAPVHLLDSRTRATAVVFLGTECPIANKSLTKLNFLSRSFARWDARLVGVLSDPRVGRKQALAWAAERKVAFPVIFDTTGDLAALLRPTHTPHAFVLDRTGAVRYHGRIDDSFPGLGQQKHDADVYDMAGAVTDVLHDRPVRVPFAQPVGCLFESWDKPREEVAPVTFTRDVAPILFSNCVTCHRAEGVAPFPLAGYDDAAKRARMLAAVTESRFMPPWKPQAGFGHFAGERRLTDRQIDVFRQWAAAGAPRGDDADLPPVPQFEAGWTLGKPDLEGVMPEPFTVPASGRDVYRAFVIPLNNPDEAFAGAVEFRPGAPSVVHHAIFYLDTTGAARRLDAADPRPGYASFGGPGFLPAGTLGGWAPGAEPHRLPEGVGRRIPPGADLVVQVHYHPDGVERVDQSRVAIHLQPSPVARRVASIPLVNRDIDIPAGDADYRRTAQMTLPVDLTVIGLVPHMHLLGREMVVTATTPDGRSIPLIHIDDWDFRWQDQYRLAEPLRLPAGTTLYMSARFDNSAQNPNNPNDPPARVRRGEQTTDEMCICFVEYIAETEADVRSVRRAAFVQKLLERMDK